jgi:hypothetical protein
MPPCGSISIRVMGATTDPRLTAWLSTTIAADALSPLKRKNLLSRLIARIEQQELGLRGSATWPRLPVAWGEDPATDAAYLGGVPRAWWPITSLRYRVALLDTSRIGSFLRLAAALARSAAADGAVTEAWAWVAWNRTACAHADATARTDRAWVFLTSHESFDAWTDGELQMEEGLTWVEHGTELADGGDTELPERLLRRFDAGEVQIRVVPLVFEGHVCLPDGVFRDLGR